MIVTLLAVTIALSLQLPQLVKRRSRNDWVAFSLLALLDLVGVVLVATRVLKPGFTALLARFGEKVLGA